MVIVAVILFNLLKVLWIIIFQATTKGYVKLRNWFHKKFNIAKTSKNRGKSNKKSQKSQKRHTIINNQITKLEKSDKPTSTNTSSNSSSEGSPNNLNSKSIKKIRLLRKRQTLKKSTFHSMHVKQRERSKVCLNLLKTLFICIS